jgi:hypothetical protein
MPLLGSLEPSSWSCAYSHTWMRELILASSAIHVLGPNDLPVLIAH